MINLDLSDSVNSIIKNTTEELTVNAGKTFGDIWYLIFGGISHSADKRRAKYAYDLAIYHQELSASMAEIPEDKRIEPALQITAQALENSKYCIEEKELREMFTALISNSMNSDFLQDVHPSFAEIIKQMSVLDAKILKKFKSELSFGIPIGDYRVQTPGKEEYGIAHENIFLELPDADPKACATSISSLERLGLIIIPFDRWLNSSERYDVFWQHALYHALQEMHPDCTISVDRKIAVLTSLGKQFVHVCIPD